MDRQKKFVNEIIKAGIEVSSTPIKVIRINKLIDFNDGKKFISIQPSKINLKLILRLDMKTNL